MTLLTFQKEADSTPATSARPAQDRRTARPPRQEAVAPGCFAPARPADRTARAVDRWTPPPLPVPAELRRLLFGRPAEGRLHDLWRAVVSDEEFAPRAGTADERIARSYARLRHIDAVLGDSAELARDPRALAALHEWTPLVDAGLCTVAGIHYNLFLGSLLDHDGEKRDLTPYTTLRRTGTFLCTELEHGNDAAALETTATLDPATGGFVLHTPTPGAQKFMPNTSTLGGPKSALVAARLLIDGADQGVFLFLTPLSDERGLLPGITVRRVPERSGPQVDHCLTAFDTVRLPPDALLEAEHGRLDDHGRLHSSLGNRRKRFLHAIGRVTTGKLCMSASGLGMARAALGIAVRYALDRHIGGPRAGERVPLAAHRSHHGRLLAGIATAYGMTFLHREAVARWSALAAGDAEDTGNAGDTGDTGNAGDAGDARDGGTRTGDDATDRAAAERLVALTKSWVTWNARSIVVECRERCGAQGLFAANVLADLQPAVEGAITAEGDNLVVMVKAAAEMIFGQESDPGRYPELTASERTLDDPRFLRDLLARLEALWRDRARAALRQGPSGDPVGRWNAASPAALEMASAHTRLRSADAFLDAVDRAGTPEARALLTKLCRLHLLGQLSGETGELFAAGALTTRHLRGFARTVENTLAELAPHLADLVDAFGLPSAYLARVPIADGGYLDRLLDEAGGPGPATMGGADGPRPA